MSKAIYIFDSSQKKTVSSDIKQKLKQLYPKINVTQSIQYRSVYEHMFDTSCAIFAIAFAITIILRKNPSRYPYRLNDDNNSHDEVHFLRQHMTEILKNGCLKEFPIMEQIVKIDTTFSKPVNSSTYNKPASITATTNRKTTKTINNDNSIDLTECNETISLASSHDLNRIKLHRLIRDMVLKKNECLTNEIILKIIKLIEINMKDRFTIQQTQDDPKKYIPILHRGHDIEIIFEPPVQKGHIGHWYTIYIGHRPKNMNEVHVFDSASSNTPSVHLQNCIKRLYNNGICINISLYNSNPTTLHVEYLLLHLRLKSYWEGINPRYNTI